MCRSPHGERGLKYCLVIHTHLLHMSLSSRRAWIEISSSNPIYFNVVSLSSRRAWIEIQTQTAIRAARSVALLTESVDWNILSVALKPTKNAGRSPHGERGLKCVSSLIHEKSFKGRSPHGERGLKSNNAWERFKKIKSLSSRRAWIEIRWGGRLSIHDWVALLTESVDWNCWKIITLFKYN